MCAEVFVCDDYVDLCCVEQGPCLSMRIPSYPMLYVTFSYQKNLCCVEQGPCVSMRIQSYPMLYVTFSYQKK